MTTRLAIGFVWEQFGEYHMDRCEALGRHLGADARIVGIEHATTSDTYDWAPSASGTAFTKITLFPGENAERLGQWRLLARLIAATRRHGIRRLFICGYDKPAHFGLALWAVVTGRRVILMNESKYDDRPRTARFEFLKQIALAPYQATLVPGRRAAAYVRFLGLGRRPVAEGYSTVSLARMRAHAAGVPPVAWEVRPFVIVARLVAKKNLALALAAYRRYRDRTGAAARALRICGDGPLLAELRAQAAELGIADTVMFLGSLDQRGVARELSGALALLLPSREEQWGLVVNEALAFGLPVIVASNVGACDRLVGSLRNGFVLDAEDKAAWAEAMHLVAHDRATWDRLHAGALERAPLADVGAFVEGCVALLAPARAGISRTASGPAAGGAAPCP